MNQVLRLEKNSGISVVSFRKSRDDPQIRKFSQARHPLCPFARIKPHLTYQLLFLQGTPRLRERRLRQFSQRVPSGRGKLVRFTRTLIRCRL